MPCHTIPYQLRAAETECSLRIVDHEFSSSKHCKLEQHRPVVLCPKHLRELGELSYNKAYSGRSASANIALTASRAWRRMRTMRTMTQNNHIISSTNVAVMGMRYHVSSGLLDRELSLPDVFLSDTTDVILNATTAAESVDKKYSLSDASPEHQNIKTSSAKPAKKKCNLSTTGTVMRWQQSVMPLLLESASSSSLLEKPSSRRRKPQPGRKYCTG